MAVFAPCNNLNLVHTNLVLVWHPSIPVLNPEFTLDVLLTMMRASVLAAFFFFSLEFASAVFVEPPVRNSGAELRTQTIRRLENTLRILSSHGKKTYDDALLKQLTVIGEVPHVDDKFRSFIQTFEDCEALIAKPEEKYLNLSYSNAVDECLKLAEEEAVPELALSFHTDACMSFSNYYYNQRQILDLSEERVGAYLERQLQNVLFGDTKTMVQILIELTPEVLKTLKSNREAAISKYGSDFVDNFIQECRKIANEKVKEFSRDVGKDEYLDKITLGKKILPMMSINLRKFDILYMTTNSALKDLILVVPSLKENIKKAIPVYEYIYTNLRKPEDVNSIVLQKYKGTVMDIFKWSAFIISIIVVAVIIVVAIVAIKRRKGARLTSNVPSKA